jgi:hypothetical protein
MLAWHGVDVNRANGAEVTKRCSEIANRPDGDANSNDIYGDHHLAGEINLNPLVSSMSSYDLSTYSLLCVPVCSASTTSLVCVNVVIQCTCFFSDGLAAMTL